ncbi:MAG: class I SAM-dependent methyltransferase [bacterium]
MVDEGLNPDMPSDVRSTIKHAYAATAQQAGSLLTRVGVLDDDAPDRDRRLKHWAYSLTRVHDSLAIAKLGVPWWTYRAIDVVDAWLVARPHPIRVFEYGSGASTLWLADRSDEVHSVEHHREFGEMIGIELAPRSNVDFRIVEPVASSTPTIGSAKEGNAGLDFSAYVDTIDVVGGVFDVVVIDGRAREACLRAAIPYLAHAGLIVFDNTRRRRYRQAIEASGLTERRLAGLTPTLPYPDQTSVLSR